MGNDARQSVVDRDLRAHDHANLFIVGGMVFPTAGMHPPTLTIAALALRAARTIEQGAAR
jgi:glucose dehydrogenase